MRYVHLVLLATVLSLSGCTRGVATAPSKSDCDFFGNCRCTDWYNNCSVHD